MTFGFTLLCGLVGLGLVFHTWNSQQDTHPPVQHGVFLAAGWSCVLLSMCLLVIEFGIEFGLVYTTCLIFFLPIPFLAINLQARHPIKSEVFKFTPINWQFERWPQQVLTGLFITVACCVFSLVATLAMTIPLHWSDVGRMTFMVLLFPLFWAVAAIFFLYHSRKSRAACWIVGLSVICGLAIYLTR
ncbi:hypothetical protein [Arenicella chitinivorans]|uniref:hypothetical protein n=1 Tax=Arenicella chitinivorans TaxID=1329800 RepID=UPI0016730533|nr:hypothetical protein [Arenicella chitinivorans]